MIQPVNGGWITMKTGLALAVLTISGAAASQTLNEIKTEVFCNDFGRYSAQAIADYRDGLSEDVSLQRVDGYICMDDKPFCDIRKNELRRGIRGMYEDLMPRLHVREMSASQFLNFEDVARTGATSACMKGSTQ